MNNSRPPGSTASEPTFVVVGNVNRGKSSIVSTLAADERVRISSTPRTTTHCQRFPMQVDGVTLYTLVDSPGFERARQALAWLNEHQGDTLDRRRTVETFVTTQSAAGAFPQECELLRPILEGAAILYVVDGSQPFSPRYEAEMEILRWTGQPRMALINPVEDSDHSQAWRSVLDQYFNMVRIFDAHQADFDQRLQLLRALRELVEGWRVPMDRAIEVLQEDRRRCFHESAVAMADLLVDVLTMVVERPIPDETHPDRLKGPLTEEYYEKIRKREEQCQKRLQDIYMLRSVEIEPEVILRVDDDLFSEATWTQMGLRRAQLVAAGAVAGAATGGLIDAGVGGASFMAGTVIGGFLGGAAAYWTMDRLPKITYEFLPHVGRTMRIGPMKNPNFPWIVLNRILLYHKILAGRSHARRDKVRLIDEQGDESLVSRLPSDQRGAIERTFRQLGSSWSLQTRDGARQELTRRIEALLDLKIAGGSAG